MQTADVRVDELLPGLPGDGDALVSVGDEVRPIDAHDVDRVIERGGVRIDDVLESLLEVLPPGPEAAVEVLRPADRADDVGDPDRGESFDDRRSQPELALELVEVQERTTVAIPADEPHARTIRDQRARAATAVRTRRRPASSA